VKYFISSYFDKLKQYKFFVLAIVILSFVLYGNSLKNQYNIDDYIVTGIDTTVQKGIKAIPDIFTSLYHDNGKVKFGYRPIVKSFFAVEYQFFGNNPFVSHLINLLIYCLTGIFLFFLLRKILWKYNALFWFTIVVLFIAHPIHTEVVNSLKNREELISFLAGLFSLYTFFKYSENGRIKYFIFGVIWFVFAYLTKQSILTFIVIIPLTIYFFTNTSLKKTIIITGVLILAGYLVASIPSYFLPVNTSDQYFLENPLFFTHGKLHRFPTAMVSLLYYLKLLFYPHPLLYYYGFNMIPVVGYANGWFILSFVIHISLLVFAILKIREKNILSFAILYYLIAISMFSNIYVPVTGIIAERLVYSASLGFCIIIAWLIFRLLKIDSKLSLITAKTRTKLLVVLIVILIPYSVKVIARNTSWENDTILAENDMPYLENSAKANGVYATRLLFELLKVKDPQQLKQMLDLSEKHYKKSIELCPDYPSSQNNLGYIYLMYHNEYQKAIPYFHKAIELNPNYPEAYFYNGLALEKMQKFEEAVKCYKKTIEISPNYIDAISKLANWSFRNNNFDEAIRMNQQIIKINSATELPYINMGNYYLMRGDTSTAVSYWEIAFQKNPDNYLMQNNLSGYYKERGNFQKAAYYSSNNKQ
jgi:tetratricopeptide (TPR) repeat protein